jgi:hypothetical protein
MLKSVAPQSRITAVRPRRQLALPRGVAELFWSSTMDDVTWLPAPGAPNYQVSSDGRVRSLARWVDFGKKSRRFQPACERAVFIVKGYPHLTLNVDCRKKNFYVHLLVCEAFHGLRPSPLHEVRHLNGDPLDNRAENLAWGTKKENAQDSIRHGTNKERNKTHCKRGHPFDAENTFYTTNGGRGCRACQRWHGKRYYESTRVEHSQRARVRREKRAAEEGRTLRTHRGSLYEESE